MSPSSVDKGSFKVYVLFITVCLPYTGRRGKSRRCPQQSNRNRMAPPAMEGVLRIVLRCYATRLWSHNLHSGFHRVWLTSIWAPLLCPARQYKLKVPQSGRAGPVFSDAKLQDVRITPGPLRQTLSPTHSHAFQHDSG